MKFLKPLLSQYPSEPYLKRLNLEPFLAHENKTESPSRPLEIPPEMRFRHIYIAGASQHGKSTLMENMIAQDIHNGEGLTVLDPKGDLAKAVLHRVPPHRENECIYISLENPVPINLMEWHSEHERQSLLSEIHRTFMRFSQMPAGDQWGAILQWTIHTLLASKCASFLDIYYFFVDTERQKHILSSVRERNVDGIYNDILEYWKPETGAFAKTGKPREGPILTRMSQIVTTPPLKTLFSATTGGVNVAECMEGRKILIVNLLGAGRENGNLAGTLFVAKIQQAAFRRHQQEKRNRIPHYLYVDEFQNFQTSDFKDILAEAGGFKLSLTLANQGFYQLDADILQAILTNVNCARIAFQLNHNDVPNWKHLFTQPATYKYEGKTYDNPDYIDPNSLSSLNPYQMFVKIGRGSPAIVSTPDPLPNPTAPDIDRADRIRAATLKDYPSNTATFAGNSQKRGGDKSACDSQPISHDEGNGIDYNNPGSEPLSDSGPAKVDRGARPRNRGRR